MRLTNYTLFLCGLVILGCGDGDRSVTENFVNVNCNTNIFTSTVPASKAAEKMASLEDAGADVLRIDDLPGGDVSITYAVEQCNGNGNIDQSKPGDTHIETHEQ